jgi:hypothetical protein
MPLIEGDRLYVLEEGKRLGYLLKLADRYDAFAYMFDGTWYLIAAREFAEVRSVAPSDRTARLLDRRFLADRVTVAARPSHRALVLDAAGRVTGAWLEEPPPETTPRRSSWSSVRGRDFRGAADEVLDDANFSFSREAFDFSIPEEAASAPAAAPEIEEITETIRRTPHLDAPKKIAKKPGTELTAHVYVDTKERRAGETGEGIVLDLPPEVESIEVGVLLQLVGPFELAEGSEFRTLTIARDKDKSAKLDFKLRVTATDEPGPATISALFTLKGRSCGQVARHWDWTADGAKAPCIEADAEAPVSMPLHVGAEQPSLSVFITAPAGGTIYMCAVQAPGLEGYEQPTTSVEWALPPAAAGFKDKLMKGLSDANSTPAKRFRALGKIGHETWEAAPQIVQDVLWKMIEEKVPPTTINIASVEPILPWELMIPRRTVDGKLQKLGPLGVEFAVGRWTRGDAQGPSPKLPVDRSFVIAPEYPGKRKLDGKRELDLIEAKLNGERVDPATIDDLDKRFADEQASLLHFVCHGAAGKEDDDVIILDGNEALGAGEMETLYGFEALCQAKHPLVFLNSCSTGQVVPSLAGGAGFPKSFGTIGANAIIAPLWPVDDKLAGKIAVELYEAALEPDAEPLAEILRQIRRRGYQEENADTYAAYCFFGDPHARLELVESALF